jgi:hypothetical protein
MFWMATNRRYHLSGFSIYFSIAGSPMNCQRAGVPFCWKTRTRAKMTSHVIRALLSGIVPSIMAEVGTMHKAGRPIFSRVIVSWGQFFKARENIYSSAGDSPAATQTRTIL